MQKCNVAMVRGALGPDVGGVVRSMDNEGAIFDLDTPWVDDVAEELVLHAEEIGAGGV